MGKPPIGEVPMTDAERKRRSRDIKRGLIPNEKEMTDKQKLARLREENRLLRSEVHRLQEEAGNTARRENMHRHQIEHLEMKLQRALSGLGSVRN